MYLGMPPAGAMNRCRPYVPSRTIWGAVTAEVSRSLWDDSGVLKYKEIGDLLMGDCRFTYLYPADKRDESYRAWLPRYKKGRGLTWGPCDGKEPTLDDREFRRHLFTSRASTAVDPSSDSALEGSLREMECISNSWISRKGDLEGVPSGQVYMTGYFFIKNSVKQELIDKIENLTNLFIGGDSRYGLGEIAREIFIKDRAVFGREVKIDDSEYPTILSDLLLAHTYYSEKIDNTVSEVGNPNYDDKSNSLDQTILVGKKEIAGGWELSRLYNSPVLWSPGSVSNGPKWWTLLSADGRWDFLKKSRGAKNS